MEVLPLYIERLAHSHNVGSFISLHTVGHYSGLRFLQSCSSIECYSLRFDCVIRYL